MEDGRGVGLLKRRSASGGLEDVTGREEQKKALLYTV